MLTSQELAVLKPSDVFEANVVYGCGADEFPVAGFFAGVSRAITVLVTVYVIAVVTVCNVTQLLIPAMRFSISAFCSPESGKNGKRAGPP